MAVRLFEREQLLPVERGRAFEIFSEPSNLEPLTPPRLRFRIISAPERIAAGSELSYQLRLHGVPVRWLTQIALWDPPDRFVDVQVRGPFALWEHTHSFEDRGDQTLMRDVIRYRSRFGPFGEVANALFVARDLTRIFDYRREALSELLG
jgi:ligand-binding SRPBCC domain-containing protein